MNTEHAVKGGGAQRGWGKLIKPSVPQCPSVRHEFHMSRRAWTEPTTSPLPASCSPQHSASATGLGTVSGRQPVQRLNAPSKN